MSYLLIVRGVVFSMFVAISAMLINTHKYDGVMKVNVKNGKHTISRKLGEDFFYKSRTDKFFLKDKRKRDYDNIIVKDLDEYEQINDVFYIKYYRSEDEISELKSEEIFENNVGIILFENGECIEFNINLILV